MKDDPHGLDAELRVLRAIGGYRRVLRGEPVPALDAALREARLALCGDGVVPRRDILDAVWRWEGRRRLNDSVLRTVIVSKLLRSASMLSPGAHAIALELRASTSIVDCAFLGGNSTAAYEIKSGIDSMSRMPNQLESFRSVFPRTFVVGDQVSRNRLSRRLAGSGIGLVVVHRVNGRWAAETELDAIRSWERVDHAALLGMLRAGELRNVVESVSGERFDQPALQMYSEGLSILRRTSVENVANHVYAQLANRLNAKPGQIVRNVPPLLRPLIVAINPSIGQLSYLRDWLYAEV